MILEFLKEEFEALPIREDVGYYIDGLFYRSKTYPKMVFKRRGKDWDAYRCDLLTKEEWLA